MQTIVLASNNAGKLKEFQILFSGLNVVPQSEFSVVDIEETGTTFTENALLKARHAARATGLPAIADDSGLIIPALNGEPGLYSARYAGIHGDAKRNIDKVLSKLTNVPTNQRQAHFHCCLAFVRNADDPNPIISAADWHGEIVNELAGEHGFGYDPIFFVPNYNCTAAQLPNEIKNTISHRAQALQHLNQELSNVIQT